jgi:WD40 repeat protein
VSAPDCPPEPTLTRFLAGRLPPAEEEPVARHLEHCPRCQSRLDTLSAAPLPAPAPAPAADPADQRSVETFLRQVKALGPPDPAAPPRPAAAIPPPEVPNYDILAELGRGGMGVVYKAVHRPLNRVVALKMILAGDSSADTNPARFRAEAEAVARVQHPNIVQVFEVGEAGGRPFMAMEHVPGGSLQQRLADRPHQPRPAAGLIRALARAVDAAHAQKLIHRDLKPANVLLAPAANPSDEAEREYGIPKVTDFGLAKRLDADHPSLRSAAVTGTPSHMAPEQVPEGVATGPYPPLGPWTDVWALGIILYQLLTGRPPFLGPDWMATLLQVVRRDPVPVRQLQPGVPRDLETICLKCLEKSPSRRYPTAAALADDLDRFLTGRPILARPVGLVERGFKWARRYPVAAAGVGAAVVGALTAVAGLAFALYAMDARRAAELAAVEGLRERERLAIKTRQREERLRVAAERNLYLSKIAQANLLWRDGDVARARRTLDECPPAARRWEWEYMNRCCHDGLAVGVLSPGYRVTAVATAPGWFAAAGTAPQAPGAAPPDPLVSVWADDGRLRMRAVTPGAGNPVRLAATPDGRRLTLVLENRASKRRAGVVLGWDLPSIDDNPDRPREPASRIPIGRTWAVSANGRVIAADLPDPGPGVLVHDLQSNTRLGVIPARARLLAASASGSHVAIFDGSAIRVWAAVPFQELAAWNAPGASALALDAAGRRLAYLDPGAEAVVVRELAKASDHPSRRFPFSAGGGTRSEVGLAFGSDARYLVAHSADGVRVWDMDGGWQTTLAGHSGRVLGVIPDPSGPLVATVGDDATVRLWTMSGRRPTGPSQGVYRGHAGPVRDAAFAPDRRLVTGGDDGTARVWDLTRGQQALSVPAAAAGPGVWFAADGRLLDLAGDRATWRDPVAGVPVATFPVAWAGSEPRNAQPAAFARATGGLAVIAPGRSSVHVYDAAGRRVRELGGHKFPVTSVAVSDDGRVIVTASAGLIPGGVRPQPVGELVVWDGTTGTAVHRLEESGLCVCALAVTPDGATAAVATGWPGWDRTGEPAPRATLRLMRTDAGRPLPPIAGDPHGADPLVVLAFNPGGGVLAAGRHKKRGTLDAFGLPDWKPVWEAKTPGAFAGVAFHPDGDRLAAITDPSDVTIYDVVSGAEVFRLPGPTDGPDSTPSGPRVAFSPDGRSVAAGLRGRVMVWQGSINPDADRAAWRAAAATRVRAPGRLPVGGE